MLNQHQGSCLCGEITFKVEGDFTGFYLCHCQHCQKDTGSAHAANLVSPTSQLQWLKGQDHVKTFKLPNTRHEKSFCTKCGSALPTLMMEGTLLVVPAGSLDSPAPRSPDAHLFVSSKANWDHKLELIKTYDTFPK